MLPGISLDSNYDSRVHVYSCLSYVFWVSVGLAAQGSNVSFGSGLSPNCFSLFIHEIKKCIHHIYQPVEADVYDQSCKNSKARYQVDLPDK